MPEEGIDGGEMEIVDLDFGLSSEIAAPVTNICASNHVAATTVGQTSVHEVGVAGRCGRSCPVGGSTDWCRSTPSSRGAGTFGDKARAVLPPHSATSSPTPRRRVTAPAPNTSTTPLEEIGRQVWESCRQQMRRPTVENITNGMSRMRVGSDADADDTRRASGDKSSNFHCEDDAEDAKELEIRHLGVRGRARGGCGRQQKAVSRGGRVLKAPAGEKGGKHPTWSVEEMLKLDRAKRDQQAHFDGMPHNYGHMRNWERKPRDLQKCLVEVGVKRTTDGESIAKGDAGDDNDEDGGSVQESGFSVSSTGGADKRKNIHQQTFDAIAEVMEKPDALMANTVEGASKRQCPTLERECDILEREVDAQKRHYEASDEANMVMCIALLEIAKTIRNKS
ncbi:hypothetical protein CBR_g53940 [Chara braunii]|uniref:Myb-like domain-containing protein n=1 Tax=Chara braunii TaxID=69332 RepID=A0A388MBN9_CHABU|nr:hypothetical protein CBR_g53940 [Chara braunii]|eukprot:GBG91882.1 hypothetical protein CBR_g53940 [Chara braunii]